MCECVRWKAMLDNVLQTTTKCCVCKAQVNFQSFFCTNLMNIFIRFRVECEPWAECVCIVLQKDNANPQNTLQKAGLYTRGCEAFEHYTIMISLCIHTLHSAATLTQHLPLNVNAEFYRTLNAQSFNASSIFRSVSLSLTLISSIEYECGRSECGEKLTTQIHMYNVAQSAA